MTAVVREPTPGREPIARREPGPRQRLLLNVLLLVIAVGAPLAWARANFIVYDMPGNLMDPFTDATTYLAAGERLNDSHELYRLEDGDRPVLTLPGLFTAPLLSPPPIAVAWRPLAAIPWGWAIWIVAAWASLLGTIVYLVLRVGPPAAFLAFFLSHAIGEQLAVANVNAFVPAAYVLIWNLRGKASTGTIVAILASVKLAPMAMTGWFLGRREIRTLAVVAVTLVALFLLGGFGAGFWTYVDYLATLPGNRPTALSISGLFGWAPATYVFLAGATVAAALVAPHRPRLGFGLALAASVLGTPALYASGLVGLLALAAPFAEPARHLSFRWAASERAAGGTSPAS